MADGETIGEPEKLLLILREHRLLDIGAQHLKDVREFPLSMTAISERGVAPLEGALGGVDPRGDEVQVCICRRWGVSVVE